MKTKAPSPDHQWRAQEALHTIARAEQHKKDPALMREVRSLAKQHAAAVTPTPSKGGSRGGPKGKC